MESPQVAIVDAHHVSREVGIVQVALRVHLQQGFHAELMGQIQELLAFLMAEAGSNEQHGRGTAEARLQQLIGIDDEVLVQYRQGDAHMTGLADELVVATEILHVGEYAQRRGAVLLVGEWHLSGTGVAVDPSP